MEYPMLPPELIEDETLIVEPTLKAIDDAKGSLYDGGVFILTPEMLSALQAGKLIMMSVNSEFAVFVSIRAQIGDLPPFEVREIT